MNQRLWFLRAVLDEVSHLSTVYGTRWEWLIYPAFAFLVTRVVVLGAAYLAGIALVSHTGPEFWHAMPDNVFLDVMARWDSGFYLNIARDGYQFTAGQMSTVAFFPVYPLLVNLLAPLVGGNLVLSGVLVSHICLLGALIFLYRLTELEFDVQTAQRTVFYIAAFPTAIFFSAVYTESTFLLFSVATIYFARKHQWVWAGLMGLVTSASRIVGVVIWMVVIWEWLRMHGWTLSRIHKKEAWLGLFNGLRRDSMSLMFTGLIPLGLFSYMLFLKNRFDDPIAFWTTQSSFGRGTKGLFGSIVQDFNSLLGQNFASGEIFWNSLLNLLALAAFVVISLVVCRRLGLGYGVYSILGVLIPAASGTGSLIRYALVLFPVFMMMGRWGRWHWLDRTLMTLFPVFLGIFTAIFVTWVFLA